MHPCLAVCPIARRRRWQTSSPSLTRRTLLAAALAAPLALWSGASVRAQSDPLPSWNDGAAKQAVLDLVAAATTEGGADFVAPADRIATFDQDGTTWVEQPLYGQGLFALDRLAEMAPEHPEWKETMPFKAVLDGDHAAMGKFTEKDWMEIVAVTHAGMSTADFEALVAAWLPKSTNPKLKQPVTDLVYQPMLEVMDYLRDNGFRTYIVTGGGQEFVRVYAEDVYGVPTEQVVGSSILTKYEIQDGKPVLMREPKPFFIDDGDGKAIGINLFIGKRPQIAFGNSDGDREMLEWTTAGDGERLGLLVLHDDAEREFAYGPANGLPDSHGRALLAGADGRGQGARLDGHQHEARLGHDLRGGGGQGGVIAGRQLKPPEGELAVPVAVAQGEPAIAALVATRADHTLDVVLHQQLKHRLRHGSKKVTIVLLLQKLNQRHAGVGHRGPGPWLKSANSTITGTLDGHPGYTAGSPGFSTTSSNANGGYPLPLCRYRRKLFSPGQYSPDLLTLGYLVQCFIALFSFNSFFSDQLGFRHELWVAGDSEIQLRSECDAAAPAPPRLCARQIVVVSHGLQSASPA